MSLRTEDARGWLGTLLFHLLAAIILFLWKLDISASQPEFVEVNFGSVTSISPPKPSRPAAAASTGMRTSPAVHKSKPVDLPERRASRNDEEVLRVPPASKMAADEQPSALRSQVVSSATKDRGIRTAGNRESFAMHGVGDAVGKVAAPSGSGDVGSDVGKSVSVSMQWSDGGTRRKLSGALPEYPAGVKVETQIKVEVVVQPDGSVKSVRPAQKGNTKLEDASMKETRLWKFEPLRKSSPQREQTCLITFNFQLR